MNLPNKLTISRIILIPILMAVYLIDAIPFNALIACFIFIVAIITDHLDGHIARKRNMVTDFGKFLDPIADKLVVTAGLLMLVADGTVPAPYGVIGLFIILGRDFIVGVLRQIAVTKGIVIAADKLGKLKTLTQDIAIILLFIVSFDNSLGMLTFWGSDIIAILAFITFGVSVLLTIISGTNYVVKNKEVFK
ncbi:MAG: CDP-diacylglycerol--glycerol-3-phosphate 3-phosphatidyltransferase [Spirochaetales bacterium]